MNYVVLMETIVKIIFIICAVAVPILIVWLNNRKKINETNQRTQIVLAAIEKNQETDVEDLLKKMAPTQKTKLLKEKLLEKLLWGSTITVLGVCFFIYALWIDSVGGSNPDLLHLIYFVGIILFGIGVVFLLNYFISKKMLAKELEAEEKKLTAEANL
ncbi:MAG: hypothetical protein IK144_08480 [Bacteroidaceae bacterium]|nr:hypothetical protein [Bacteroidaceae bacterium]